VTARPARLIVVVGIVAALGYTGDRIAAHVAADRIATIVKTDAGLAHTPHVTVKGFPFLTQAVSGHYRRIDVTATDIFNTGQPPGSVLQLGFADVRIPLSTVLSGNVNSVPVGTVTGTITIPFANLQAAAGVPGLSILSGVPGSADEIKVSEVVKVVTGNMTVLLTARVTAHGDSLVVTPLDLTTANGTPVPAAVKKQVLAQAVLTVKLPGLPAGVDISAVSVGSVGSEEVLVTLHATNLVLTH
jgi:LmeA-like phospholipid-binding